MQYELILCCDAQDDPDRRELGHRRECLLEVYAVLLQQTLRHDACLVSLDEALGSLLHLEHPLAADGFATAWKRHKLPRLVLRQRLELGVTRLHPLACVARLHRQLERRRQISH